MIKNKIEQIKSKVLAEYFRQYPEKIWINPMLPEFAVRIGESFIGTQYAVLSLLQNKLLLRDKDEKNSYRLSFEALNQLRNPQKK